MGLNPFPYLRALFSGRDNLAELRESVEMTRLKMEKQLLEAQSQGPNWAGNLVDQYDQLYDDPQFWMPLAAGERLPPTLDRTFRGELLPVYITWYGLKIIRDFSRRLCVYNEFAVNVIENRVSYTCGRGFQYKVMPKDGKESPEVLYLAKLAQRWVDSFTSGNNWGEKEQEAVRRCDRDGEAFIRFFHVGQGHTEARYIEPEWVKSYNEQDTDTYGIVNSPQDVQDVLGYRVIEEPPYTAPVFVKAEEILHIKGHLGSDSNTKRGLPPMMPVRKNLQRAENTLRAMSTLIGVRAAFALIRQHKQYSAASMTQWQQSQAQTNWADPLSGQQMYGKKYPQGSVIDSPDTISYNFPGMNTDVGAMVQCVQAELRAVAACVQMPEFMISQDASNNNYASISITESPFVKKQERHQTFFATRFGDGGMVKLKNAGAMWRVLANAVDFGGLPKEALTLLELQVEGPSLIGRDKLEETQRAAILTQAQIISKSTWAKWEGVDLDQEKKQIDKEFQEQLMQQRVVAMAQAQNQIMAQQAQAEAQAQQQAAAQQAQVQQAQQQAAAAQQQAGAQPEQPPQQLPQAAPQAQQVPAAPQAELQQQELSGPGGLPELPPVGQEEFLGGDPWDKDVYVEWVLDHPFTPSRAPGIVFDLRMLVESGFSGGVRDRKTHERLNFVGGGLVSWTREQLVVEKLRFMALVESKGVVKEAMEIRTNGRHGDGNGSGNGRA